MCVTRRELDSRNAQRTKSMEGRKMNLGLASNTAWIDQ